MDVRSIEGTFKSLDWEVTTYTDSTVAQIRDVILKEVININFYLFNISKVLENILKSILFRYN